jgi:predicted glycosyltransferase
MKILIDIGHPAHVHYFKNFISIMKNKGHEFMIISRDKEVTLQLLKAYDLQYISRGTGKKSLVGKFFYLIKADLFILKHAKKFKPDLFLSFGSTYAAHASRLCHKPHIALDDTEHAIFELLMYPPFSDAILNPSVYWKKFSRKQIFFESYMELFYLNPKYFTPDISIINSYGLSSTEKFFILRFVSWNASHDIGQRGLSLESKIKLVRTLEKYGKVLISSEGPLQDVLKSNQIKIRPEHLHHIIAFAALYIGEGSTTASECAVLGTPSIYVNSLIVSNCKEQQEKYGLCFHLTNENNIIEKAIEIINNKDIRQEYKEKKQRMLNDKIDGTAFLVWFVENWPRSMKIMKETPEYQEKFR